MYIPFEIPLLTRKKIKLLLMQYASHAVIDGEYKIKTARRFYKNLGKGDVI